jgi:WD40 repeat protein
MDFETVLKIVNQSVADQFDRPLSDAEVAILKGAWNAQTYDQLAAESGYSVNYLQRCAAPKFWKLLSQVYGRQINKTNARTLLPQLSSLPVSSPLFPEPPSPSPTPPTSSTIDWGEALDISVFYGREDELQSLEQSILQQQCRIVALLGMGGMGKSTLSVKLAQHLQPQFDYVIWRSLRHAPTLPMLIRNLVSFLSAQQETSTDPMRLLYYLRSHRCLVILDNLETLLQPEQVGRFSPEYADYGDLLKLLGESVHQSCLVLTSREKPEQLSLLEGMNGRVRSLFLSGLNDAGLQLLQHKGVNGSLADQQALIQHYSGNPLALKIVATSIQDVFGGDLREFLKQETTLFRGIRRLLDQQFSRLSSLEKSIMYWLAINREWTAITDLQTDLVPPMSRIHLLEALESLTWRNLIEKRSSRYTQQPAVMEYVTELLIQQISLELVAGPQRWATSPTLCLFQSHALLKTTVKEYIRDSQWRLIVQPVSDQLRSAFSTPKSLIEWALTLIEYLRSWQSQIATYGGGNLLNLCLCLNLDLTGWNLSGLALRHADLRSLSLQNVNLSNADLSQAILQQTFSYVLSVTLSPCGEHLAIGDGIGQVRLWQTADGQPLNVLQQGTASWVWAVAWSPDGRWLASGGVDRQIRLWNPHTGECLTTLEGHDNWVRSLAWNPGSNQLASGSTDGTIKLWNPQVGGCLTTLTTDTAIWSVAWSPNGKHLVSGGIDPAVRIWNSATGDCVQTLVGHTQWVRSVAWSPNGKWIASAGDDQTIRLWDASTGNCLAVLQGHHGPVWSVAWSPDSKQIASTAHDRQVKIWDGQSHHCLKTLLEHTNWVWGAVWSGDGQILVTVGHDRTVKIWDVPTWSCRRTIKGFSSVPMAIAWSPDGDCIAGSCDDQVVRLWNTYTGAYLKTLEGHENVVWGVSWHPDGQFLASSCDDYTVKLWDVATGQCLTTLEHGNWVWSVDWSPDGNAIASGTQDYTVYIWDARTGEALRVLAGHQDSIWQVRWSPDGKSLASACDDGTVRIWEVATGECNAVLSHPQSVRSVDWSADGRWLVTGSADPVLRIWEVASGQCLREMPGHTSSIWSVAWHPTRSLLASGGDDQTVRIWDGQTGECLQVWAEHQSQIWSVAWNPAGTMLASSSADQTIRIWDLLIGRTQQILRAPRPYEGMQIQDIRGVTDAQIETLRALGAVDSS